MPQKKIESDDKYSMKAFSYKSIDLYNRIDQKFTLLTNNSKLKKCLNKLVVNPRTILRIKTQQDYKVNCIEDYNSSTFYPCI